jgi:hypothetical protein
VLAAIVSAAGNQNPVSAVPVVEIIEGSAAEPAATVVIPVTASVLESVVAPVTPNVLDKVAAPVIVVAGVIVTAPVETLPIPIVPLPLPLMVKLVFELESVATNATVPPVTAPVILNPATCDAVDESIVKAGFVAPFRPTAKEVALADVMVVAPVTPSVLANVTP